MITYPVAGSKETSYRLARTNDTAYPVSKNQFWHTGVHLTGKNLVHCVYDGKIVAARVEKKYKEIEIPSEIPVESLMILDAEVWKQIEKIKSECFEEKEKKGKKVLSVKSGLKEEQKVKALSALKAYFSGSFVLIQHTHTNPYGTEILFYSLYHHLKPASVVPLKDLIALSLYTVKGTVKDSVYYGMDVSPIGFGIGTVIPAETGVTLEGVHKDGEAVIIHWQMNGRRERGRLSDGSMVRLIDKNYEMKRPSTFTKEQKDRYCDQKYLKKQCGMLLYSSANTNDRNVIGVLKKGDDFIITNPIDLFTYAESNQASIVLSIKVVSGGAKGMEGYVYANFPYPVADVYKSLTCDSVAENKRIVDFIQSNDPLATLTAYKMDIKIGLREGLSFDSIGAPKDRDIRSGDAVGYPGLMDSLNEYCHVEIFAPEVKFLDKDKGRGKEYPCEYKARKDYSISENKPSTEVKSVTLPVGDEKITSTYVLCVKDALVRFISDEPYYEIDYIAKQSVTNCWIERNQYQKDWIKFLSTNKEETDGYYVVSGAPVDGYKLTLYTEDGQKITDEISSVLYNEITYRFLDEKTVKEKVVDADGKITEGKELKLRKLECIYEKVNNMPAMCISGESLGSKTKLRYTAQRVYNIEAGCELTGGDNGSFVDLTGASLPSTTGVINKDTILLDTGVSIKIYPRKDAENHSATWIQLREEGLSQAAKKYWINENQVGQSLERRPFNDWLLFFRKVENKKGKYQIKDFSDIIKDNSALLDTANTLSKNVFGGMGKAINGCTDVERYLETVIVKNASEWKKDDNLTKAIHGDYEDQKKRVETIRNGLCFWDDAKGAAKGDKSVSFTSSEVNWYFHPIRFLEHLEKIGVYEINPYKDESPIKVKADYKMAKNKKTGKERMVGAPGGIIEVRDNPGFAPLVANGKSSYKSAGLCFAGISGMYHENYIDVVHTSDGETYGETGMDEKLHEGVDFIGGKGAEIRSLIQGEVIAWGWNYGYGRSILIANRHGVGIYLLGHLNEFNKSVLEKKYIMPLDTVGYVGESGDNQKIDAYAGSAHLHVSYFHVDYSKSDFYGLLASGSDENQNIVRLRMYNEMYSSHLRDPFNHNK